MTIPSILVTWSTIFGDSFVISLETLFIVEQNSASDMLTGEGSVVEGAADACASAATSMITLASPMAYASQTLQPVP